LFHTQQKAEVSGMMAKAVFCKDGQKITEFPFEIIDSGDFSAGAKDAFAAFRKANRTIALFDVTVTFEKMDAE
jgi:hypothetical protein